MNTKKHKFVIIHPHSIPPQRNRALFQRVALLCRETRATILTTTPSFVSEEIEKRAEKIIKFSDFGFSKRLVWKAFTVLWLYRNRPRDKDPYYLYALPYWGWASVFFAYLFKYKVIVDIQHTPYYYREYSKIQKMSYGRKLYYYLIGYLMHLMAKFCLPRVHKVIAMSHQENEGFAKILIDHYRVPKKNLIVLPNGVCIGTENSPIQKNTLQPLKFCFAGNIQSSKLDQIIDFFYAIDDLPESELHIAGLSPKIYQDVLLKKIKHGFNNKIKVIYYGLLEHEKLIALYKTCHFGLFFINRSFTDHRFSHPGKVLEYMLYGCLPIVSDTPSLRYVIEDEENGIVINDMKRDANKILKFFDPLLADEARKKAYNSVCKYNWSDINRSFLSDIF